MVAEPLFEIIAEPLVGRSHDGVEVHVVAYGTGEPRRGSFVLSIRALSQRTGHPLRERPLCCVMHPRFLWPQVDKDRLPIAEIGQRGRESNDRGTVGLVRYICILSA